MYIATQSQISALRDLYNATNGWSWLGHTGSGWTGTSIDVNICNNDNWYGIICKDDVNSPEQAVPSLYLPNKNLTGYLPSSFGHLLFFDFINLGNNGITDFEEFSTNPTNHITSFLNLQNNQLSKLPNSIGNFSNLHTLILTNNPITELPDAFRYLTSITSLCIQNNVLTSDQGLALRNVGYLTALQYLDASCGYEYNSYCYQLLEARATSLPSSCNPGIRLLPSNFNTLRALKQLMLGQVESFISLGIVICNLTALETLSVSRTALSQLPECFGNLVNLKNLYIEDLNNLVEFQFPSNEQINNLQNLQTIYAVHGLHLVEVPSFFNIHGLQKLVLGGTDFRGTVNSIKSFDITPYCELPMLKKFILSNITTDQQPSPVLPIKFLPDCNVTRLNFTPPNGSIEYIMSNLIYCPLPNWYYENAPSSVYKCCTLDML